jgi:transposase
VTRPRGWLAGGAGGRPLTPRERATLSLLIEGASPREVAERLGISAGAVPEGHPHTDGRSISTPATGSSRRPGVLSRQQSQVRRVLHRR